MSNHRDGDALAGPADSTRPRNPWPRLLAFGAVVLGSLVLVAVCVSSFASVPDREIGIRDNEFQPGVPRFIAVASFGHDASGNTYGAYLAVPEDGQAAAFLSRDPESGCNLRWDATAQARDATGLFVDPCSEGRYDFAGRAVHDGARRDLHRLDVHRDAVGYVVTFEELTLGTCRNGNEAGCSPAGGAQQRTIPNGALPADLGNE